MGIGSDSIEKKTTPITDKTVLEKFVAGGVIAFGLLTSEYQPQITQVGQNQEPPSPIAPDQLDFFYHLPIVGNAILQFGDAEVVNAWNPINNSINQNRLSVNKVVLILEYPKDETNRKIMELAPNDMHFFFNQASYYLSHYRESLSALNINPVGMGTDIDKISTLTLSHRLGLIKPTRKDDWALGFYYSTVASDFAGIEGRSDAVATALCNNPSLEYSNYLNQAESKACQEIISFTLLLELATKLSETFPDNIFPSIYNENGQINTTPTYEEYVTSLRTVIMKKLERAETRYGMMMGKTIIEQNGIKTANFERLMGYMVQKGDSFPEELYNKITDVVSAQITYDMLFDIYNKWVMDPYNFDYQQIYYLTSLLNSSPLSDSKLNELIDTENLHFLNDIVKSLQTTGANLTTIQRPIVKNEILNQLITGEKLYPAFAWLINGSEGTRYVEAITVNIKQTGLVSAEMDRYNRNPVHYELFVELIDRTTGQPKFVKVSQEVSESGGIIRMEIPQTIVDPETGQSYTINEVELVGLSYGSTELVDVGKTPEVYGSLVQTMK